jgi:LytS/YehU family sensor histidine kinase
VDINPEMAKSTILELSKLMRYVLYEGAKTLVPLQKDINFLRNYINLMKLRYTDKVKIDIDIQENIPDKSIPPMLLITFVENAFKHGICAEGGHISIRFDAYPEKGIIKNCIRNSNHPRENRDTNGHGAGLTLTQRRLELLYPDKYEWEKGVDQKTNEYYSNLTIYI